MPPKKRNVATTKPAQAKARAAKPKKQAQLFTFDVLLIDRSRTRASMPKKSVVSRTIQLRGDQSLEDLHDAIFDAFDRYDEHLYEFQFGKEPMDRKAVRYAHPFACEDFWGEEEDANSAEAKLASLGLKTGQSFFYWFDFGDDWWHDVRVEAIDDKAPAGKYPKVVKEVGKAPPQYPDFDDED